MIIAKFEQCSHVGRVIKGKSVTAFIRVAEIRKAVCVLAPGNCPDCNRGD
jgi:hypothetical protein